MASLDDTLLAGLRALLGRTGGGMGHPAADPAGTAEILRRRAEELRATGAGVTVTACPTAVGRLRAARLSAFALAAYLAARLEGSA